MLSQLRWFLTSRGRYGLRVRDIMLRGWPKSPKDFRERYRWHSIPWCTPPDMIKVFWLAFLVGILDVTMVASYALNSEHFVDSL